MNNKYIYMIYNLLYDDDYLDWDAIIVQRIDIESDYMSERNSLDDIGLISYNVFYLGNEEIVIESSGNADYIKDKIPMIDVFFNKFKSSKEFYYYGDDEVTIKEVLELGANDLESFINTIETPINEFVEFEDFELDLP